MNRIEGLDLLRGVCAIGVSVYHFSSWLQLGLVSNNIGYYFVYIFFVISGTSLYLSYSARLNSLDSIKNFILIRFFRLAPLFVLVVAMTPFFRDASFVGYDLQYLMKSVLNIAFAFGLGNPGINSLVAGGWSLGIEFSYYLIFPIFLACLGIKLFFITFVLQVIFVNLVAGQNNWGQYVQPLAFVWYFYAGCFLAMVCVKNERLVPKLRRIALIVSTFFLVFILCDRPETMADVLTGWRSVIMPLLCAILVFSMFRSIKSPVVRFFGDVSYGFYLIHPLVFYQVQQHLGNFDTYVKLTVFIVTTATFAYFIKHFIEMPLLHWAKCKFSLAKSSLS